MKKLSLNLDQLRVESFGTHPSPAGGGTVAAYAGTVLHCQSDPYVCGTVMRMSCASSCTQDPEICPAF
jgi:hypothetical protein